MIRKKSSASSLKEAVIVPVPIEPVDGESQPGTEGTRHTLIYGQYRLNYEIYGSGDRVLVWLHGILLDANLSRGPARGPRVAPRSTLPPTVPPVAPAPPGESGDRA